MKFCQIARYLFVETNLLTRMFFVYIQSTQIIASSIWVSIKI